MFCAVFYMREQKFITRVGQQFIWALFFCKKQVMEAMNNSNVLANFICSNLPDTYSVEFTNHPWKRKNWQHHSFINGKNPLIYCLHIWTASTNWFNNFKISISFCDSHFLYLIQWCYITPIEESSLFKELRSNLCQWAYFLVLFYSQLLCPPELINQLLGRQEFQLDQDLHTSSPFRLDFTVLKFCRHQNPLQKSHELLYISLVNLVSIQPFFGPLKLLSFFCISFCFAPVCFFLFAWRLLKVFAFHQNSHGFSRHVICYFYYWQNMCTCKKLHRQDELSRLERLYKGKE